MSRASSTSNRAAKRLPVLLVALLLVVCGRAAAAPDPLACSGYPQPRVFLESQAWWQQTPGKSGTNFGHVHTGTCFPYLQPVSGTVQLDVRTMLHDNPGTFYKIEVQAFNDAYGVVTLNATYLSGRVGDGTYWNTVSVDTRQLAYDGLTEFRVRSKVKEPDGAVMVSTDGWLAYVRNGKTVRDTGYLSPGITESRGWYQLPNGSELGYENSRLRSRIPNAPVSGTWSPEVQTTPGAGPSAPVTHTLVTIDPNFHAVPLDRGWVQVDRVGSYRGYLSIDTRKLANGPHKLVIIASADQAAGSTLSGVQAIPFTVAN